MLKKAISLYELIYELPFAVTITLKAGVALGLLYGAAVTIAQVENREPTKIEKVDSLEEALDKTVAKIESCPPELRRIFNENDIVDISCYDHGVASISMVSKQASFLCIGSGCPTRVSVTYNEYIPRYDAPPLVTSTFTRTN